MRVATASTEIRQGFVQVATGLSVRADRSRRQAYCDQIATERSVAMALVNAANQAVAFTGSTPSPNRERTLHWIAGQNLPYLTQDRDDRPVAIRS
ncbi:hypothetical protein Taro_003402 [Colocasia esculenta]|uniref:Uncharacterized protein n=1 Tax=Colocasia esculenta TaxID=4460 RepID=A0A843TJQ9_COLES|nr:hypothetical protein [Colocasia esculenta]